jgi:hypothetical protein
MTKSYPSWLLVYLKCVTEHPSICTDGNLNIFHGDAIYPSLSTGRQSQFIPQGACHLPVSRSSCQILRPDWCANQLVPIVGNGTHLAEHAVGGRLLPFIEGNLMTVGVGPGPNSCVAGSGDQVGVIVVTVGEVCSLLQE